MWWKYLGIPAAAVALWTLGTYIDNHVHHIAAGEVEQLSPTIGALYEQQIKGEIESLRLKLRMLEKHPEDEDEREETEALLRLRECELRNIERIRAGNKEVLETCTA